MSLLHAIAFPGMLSARRRFADWFRGWVERNIVADYPYDDDM